jgi:hypothetical protein
MLVFKENGIFSQKIGKIDENCYHSFDPICMYKRGN